MAACLSTPPARIERSAPARPRHLRAVGGTMVSDADVAEFQAVRPRLFGIAYRMLGSVGDADDVVQDAWLRWQTTDRSKVRDAAAFLATVTIRLALNVVESARRQARGVLRPARSRSDRHRAPIRRSQPSGARASSSWRRRCWSGSRHPSAPPTCCEKGSTTRTARSQSSWRSAMRTRGNSSRALAFTSRAAAPGESRPPISGDSSRRSSRLPGAVTSRGSSGCSPAMWRGAGASAATRGGCRPRAPLPRKAIRRKGRQDIDRRPVLAGIQSVRSSVKHDRKADHENRRHRWHRPHRLEGRDQARRAWPRGGGRLAGLRRQHADGRGPRRSAGGRVGGRRRLELPVVRGRGGDGVLPDLDQQPARRGRRQAGVGHHVALSVVGTDRLRRQRLLPREDRAGEADQGIGDPVLDRARDAVLRVRQGHRRRCDRRRHGAPAAGAVPADRGRRRRRRPWAGSRWARR